MLLRISNGPVELAEKHAFKVTQNAVGLRDYGDGLQNLRFFLAMLLWVCCHSVMGLQFYNLNVLAMNI